MNVHTMTKDDFQDFMKLLSTFPFGEEEDVKKYGQVLTSDKESIYRISLLVYTVSHGFRPAVGFEVPFSKYCIDVEDCNSSVKEFFKDRNLNLKLEDKTTPLPLVYNTFYPRSFFKVKSGEDMSYYMGRIFGYWVPLSYENFQGVVDENPISVNINVLYKGFKIYLMGFNSPKMITLDDDKLKRLYYLRRILNKLGIKNNTLIFSIDYTLGVDNQIEIVKIIL